MSSAIRFFTFLFSAFLASRRAELRHCKSRIWPRLFPPENNSKRESKEQGRFCRNLKSTHMITQVENVVCAKETREGEGFTYVHQDYVAHFVLLTPRTAVMTICSPGKPSEIVENTSEKVKDFTYVHQNSVDKRAS